MTETRNPAITEHDIELATSPQGISRLGVLYRGYPHAAIPAGTPVLTTNGFKPAGKLVITDMLISGKGQPAKISAICKNPAEPIYRVDLKSGRSVKLSANGLWSVYETPAHEIRRPLTAKDIYDRTQKHIEQNLTNPFNISMPVNRPVSFHVPGRTVIKPFNMDQFQQLAAQGFQEPIPGDPVRLSIKDRQLIIKLFAERFAKHGHDWEFEIKPEWHPLIKQQLTDILRSLGLNVHVKQSRTTFPIKACTHLNLANPDELPTRIPKPMDFRDTVIGATLMPCEKATVCIAPEPGVYDYLVKDFCVVHTSLYAMEFDHMQPCMPWGTLYEKQVALRYLYPEYAAKPRPKPRTTAKNDTVEVKPKRKRYRSIIKKKKPKKS